MKHAMAALVLLVLVPAPAFARDTCIKYETHSGVYLCDERRSTLDRRSNNDDEGREKRSGRDGRKRERNADDGERRQGAHNRRHADERQDQWRRHARPRRGDYRPHWNDDDSASRRRHRGGFGEGYSLEWRY